MKIKLLTLTLFALSPAFGARATPPCPENPREKITGRMSRGDSRFAQSAAEMATDRQRLIASHDLPTGQAGEPCGASAIAVHDPTVIIFERLAPARIAFDRSLLPYEKWVASFRRE